MNTPRPANGAAFAGAQIIGAPKFEFGEPQLRGMIEQVRKLVGANNGQMQVIDAASLMAWGVVLDKLNMIDARLTALEAKADHKPAISFVSP